MLCNDLGKKPESQKAQKTGGLYKCQEMEIIIGITVISVIVNKGTVANRFHVTYISGTNPEKYYFGNILQASFSWRPTFISGFNLLIVQIKICFAWSTQLKASRLSFDSYIINIGIIANTNKKAGNNLDHLKKNIQFSWTPIFKDNNYFPFSFSCFQIKTEFFP